MQFLYLYVFSIPIFIALDLLWLGLIAKSFYTYWLENLRKPTNWIAAILFYIIFNLGLTFFATMPAYTAGTVWYALVLGALYGLFSYSTYDLTNQATVRGWPVLVTVVDIIWGTVLGGGVATFTYLVASAIL